MTEPPVYNLTSLTDEQWNRQLASQEKLALAKIEADNSVELERLRNDRDRRSSRHSLTVQILTGLAVVSVVLAFIGALYFGIDSSERRANELAVECVKSQGRWIEGDRDGDRCERP